MLNLIDFSSVNSRGYQESKVSVIVNLIKKGIDQGLLPPGSKLASIRQIAKYSSFSNFTVVEALEILKSEGYIHTRPGKGIYVNENTQPKLECSKDGRSNESIEKTLSSEMLTSTEEWKPGCGFLPESWLPKEEIRQAFRSAFKQDNLNLSSYGTLYGYKPLRDHLRQRLINRGTLVGVDQILTCNSTLNGIDLIFHLLLNPDDTILIDTPSYFNIRALANLHRVNVIEYPRNKIDIDVNLFRNLVEKHRPKVYVTSAYAHNPTGHSFSINNIYPMLSILENFNVHLVEDGLYDDLVENQNYRMASLFGCENSSYISGFSKLLTANTRTSYIVSNVEQIARLAHIKRQTGGLTSNTTEFVVHQILKSGAYDRHLRRLRCRLITAKSELLKWLQANNFVPQFKQSEGLFMWVKSPVDPDKFAEAALEKGIILAPGSMFSKQPDDMDCMRFNIAHSANLEVQTALTSLLEEMQP